MFWDILALLGNLLLMGSYIVLALNFLQLYLAARGSKLAFPSMFWWLFLLFGLLVVYRAAIIIAESWPAYRHYMLVFRVVAGGLAVAACLSFQRIKAARLDFIRKVREGEDLVDDITRH